MTEALNSLGWNDWFAANFDPFLAAGLVPARVAVEQRGQYLVLTAAGEFTAEITGKLLYMADDPAELPKVGDWVAVNVFEQDQRAIIHHVLPRRTRFSRQTAGKKVNEQVIAANIDLIFVVQSADQDFNPRRLERYLMMVRDSGAEAAIILNKIDLCANLPDLVGQATAVAGNAPIITLSAMTGQNVDNSLRETMKPGKTYALVGSSGVGKTTLVNRLAGAERLKTGAVREYDSKLPGGALLIDSPGMREVQVWGSTESLEDAFADIAELATACRFANCSHTQETGCAVLAALDSGQLSRERYRSYLKLNRETAYLESKQSEQAYQNARRKEKTLQRAKKRYHKDFDTKS